MAVIEVNGLTKKYGPGRARGIENMTFSVEEGELFGFIGPNGAGKSTTIRILMNFISADRGVARICGMNCRLRSSDIKRITGYMPSEVHCYPTVKARELLDYACRLRGDKKSAWKDWADRFGLDPDKRFRELSMGNRRKLSIIQALMGRPRVLILDEPTGGLDPIMQERFFDALREARDGGATVFFSSHNLGEVQRFCDRVALVKDGRIEMMPDMKEMPMHVVELVTDSDCAALIDKVRAENVRRDGDRLSFMVQGGEMAELIRLIAQLDVRDISIGRPSLEEMFHRVYYGEAN